MIASLPRLAGNLLLAAASLAVTLLATEGAARLWASAWWLDGEVLRLPLIEHHETLGWAKAPGRSAWIRRPEYTVRLEINSLGLRGPERAYAKPEGVKRVLLVGDSFAEGFTVAEQDTVRARLEEHLSSLAVRG